MKKIINLTILAMLFAFASRAIDPIWSSGPVYCLGTSGYVMDSTTGGVWSSSNTSVATVGSTGITVSLTPVSAGVATITYTVGSSYVTLDITVNPSPAAISGPSSVCSGASITLTDATTGGVWSSYSTSTATVGSVTGVVTGVASGGDYIYYTVGGCSVSKYVTVDPVSGGLSAITGDSMVCIGSTITLADATSGGTWSSSDVTIATVSSSGVVTGVSSGSVTISYTVTGTCGATSVTYMVSVVPVSTASISGPTSVSVGSTISLTGSGGTGSWFSSSTSIATVSSSGVVTGVSSGVVTISYTTSTICGTASATYTVTVNPSAPISGTIYFDSSAYTGPVHVWLITYTPSTHMLEAVDSQWVDIFSGTSIGYSFNYEPTDSYRVKANIYDTTGGSSMYVPTYHTSSFYWYSADVINHVSTTANTGVDIHMMSGTPTTGPGFIGGDVTTGANRGTSSSVPAVGLQIYLLNSAGKVVKRTVTDATGAYSFSSLPLGSYTVFPEDLQYMTTPYSSITLTSTSSSLTVANFVQHTISYTITPVTEGVQNVTASNATINMFPNPASGMLNIEWTAKTADAATITISDVAGREVFNAPLNMAAGSGSHQINISNLTNGMYFVSIQSASTSYINKLNVAH
jgi:Secretion system C-terminal sorting domain/Carboxypeptidase regulatory-like domain/Bacterial Ig-like domain (group 2)